MNEHLSIDAYENAVHRLYPCEDTINGGVPRRRVEQELGRSKSQTTTQLRILVAEGRLRRLDGLRGPVYAPPKESDTE